MADNKKRIKYRLTLSDDKNFEEKWHFSFSKSSFIAIAVIAFVLLVGGTYCLLAFTNLRGLIPGYPNTETRRNILLNAVRLDSLEHEIDLRDRFFANMNSIISGNGPSDSFSMQESTGTYSSGTFDYSSLVEAPSNNNGSQQTATSESVNLASLHFFPPMKGLISSSYNPATKHFGTDIAASSETFVSSVLDGTIIFEGWTVETGYVMHIQHTNNIISIYKHNTVLLKEVGDYVRAGEPISVIGDSGEMYTSGPHLHIELWYKGESLDPEKFILF